MCFIGLSFQSCIKLLTFDKKAFLVLVILDISYYFFTGIEGAVCKITKAGMNLSSDEIPLNSPSSFRFFSFYIHERNHKYFKAMRFLIFKLLPVYLHL